MATFTTEELDTLVRKVEHLGYVRALYDLGLYAQTQPRRKGRIINDTAWTVYLAYLACEGEKQNES